MPSSRPTLQDIAERVGVAKSTVSMALKHHPRIPAETVARIERAAKELGYRPDPVLSAMGRNRWRGEGGNLEIGRVLAYVHDIPRKRALKTVDRFRGAQAEAERLGYRLEGFRFGELNRSAKRLCAVLAARGIRGVLFDSMLAPGDFAEFRWREVASVWCGTHTEEVVTHTIELDAFRRFEDAWERARASGARRIGFVVWNDVPDERWAVSDAAYRACCARDRLTEIEVLDVRAFSDARERRARLAGWMKNRPDVVISTDNSVLWLLRESGWRVPEKVGFISLHIWEGPAGVSGYSAMLEEQGEAAVRLLHHDLINYQLGLPVNPLVVTIRPKWLEGETLGERARAR